MPTDRETTEWFIDDLSRRIATSPMAEGMDGTLDPQISTDGWASYPPSIANSFGELARYGVVIKNYCDHDTGRP